MEHFGNQSLNLSGNTTAGCLEELLTKSHSNLSASTLPQLSFNAMYTGISVVLIIIAITALVGNLLVCCAICMNDYFRSSPTYYFIFSLAVSDLLTASLSMTFDAEQMLNGNKWKHGELMCNIYTTVYSIAVPTSILNLLAVSVVRYKSLSDPLSRYRQTRFMTRRRALIVIAVLWVYCVTFSLIPVMGWKSYSQSVKYGLCYFNMAPAYSVVSSCINFLLPLLVMCVVYGKIYVIAQNRNDIFKGNPDLATSSVNANNNTIKHINRNFLKNIKAAKNILLIVTCFVLCWMPYTIVSITGVFYRNISSYVYHCLLALGYLNSSLNPILYSLQNRRFQETYRHILGMRRSRKPAVRTQSRMTQLSLMISRNSSIQASLKGNHGNVNPRYLGQQFRKESTL